MPTKKIKEVHQFTKTIYQVNMKIIRYHELTEIKLTQMHFLYYKDLDF